MTLFSLRIDSVLKRLANYFAYEMKINVPVY